MEETRKKKLIIILDEQNVEKVIHCDNIKINKDGTFTFSTSDNIFTMPLTRLIKVKEDLNGSSY